MQPRAFSADSSYSSHTHVLWFHQALEGTHTPHAALHTPHAALHIPHSSLHGSTFHTPWFHIPHSSLHGSTFHTPWFHIPHSTLHGFRQTGPAQWRSSRDSDAAAGGRTRHAAAACLDVMVHWCGVWGVGCRVWGGACDHDAPRSSYALLIS
eukprot:354973-Chlamydomonas_euryale.AAC.5